MDNLETVAIVGTKDTERTQSHKQPKKQITKKTSSTDPAKNNGGES